MAVAEVRGLWYEWKTCKSSRGDCPKEDGNGQRIAHGQAVLQIWPTEDGIWRHLTWGSPTRQTGLLPLDDDPPGSWRDTGCFVVA